MIKPRWGVFAVAVGTLMFGAAIAARETYNPWLSNIGAAGAAILLSFMALRGRRVRKLLAIDRHGALVAVGLGVLMVAVTHASFHVAIGLIPSLDVRVAELYSDIRAADLGVVVTLPLIIAVVFAEELLWRGVAVELCQRRFSRAVAALVSVALYAVPQLIGGALILVCAALVVGGISTIQRVITGRISEPLITHAIWSVSIFSVAPLR